MSGTRFDKEYDVIELEAVGVAMGMDKSRPVLLFREVGGEAVLPVWVSPMDAGIVLTDHNVRVPAVSPHEVSLKAFAELGLRLEACHFREIKGYQQYVELKFSGSRKLKEMRVRADHAVSFCLQAKARFFCTRDYLAKCREVEAEINESEVKLRGKSSRKPDRQYLN